MNYKIVSDSASNVFSMEDVSFSSVPLKIVCEEREYVDTPELDVEKMTNELKATKAPSRTSCPNVADWAGAFSDNVDGVFGVAITSGLSGSYNAAEQAKEISSEEKNKPIHIFDSLSAGPEMRLIVEKIAELVKGGELFSDIVTKVNEYMKKTKLLFSLESLSNFAKNGRVSPAIAKITGLLGIRIIGKASDEGTLQPLHKARGAEKGISTLVREMLSSGFCGGKVRIAHCFNIPAAEKIRELLLSHFPKSDILIEKCGGLCSFYAEKGGVLVGYET